LKPKAQTLTSARHIASLSAAAIMTLRLHSVLKSQFFFRFFFFFFSHFPFFSFFFSEEENEI